MKSLHSIGGMELIKKTYNRIFALTLEDLQGLDVLQEVEVRSRFFGAEGGEHLGSVVRTSKKGLLIYS